MFRENMIKKIRKKFLGIHNWLINLSPMIFVPLMTVFSYLILFSFIPVLLLIEKKFGYRGTFNNDSIDVFHNEGLLLVILLTVVLAPIVETAVFQMVPIRYLRKTNFLKEKPMITILISAVFFGLGHTYNIIRVIETSLIGIILAYSYYIYLEKNYYPFWIVTSIHGLRNLMTTILLLIST
ncbi:Abortive infection protein [Alkaliphilus metalliredigens QYMF]|uniref:Abortive infection protein n=1 Tax=Alkaliphilus metalliredigens (strain QYMF) TaxID=293826 RepID=A6TM49_ALKMQ|nr:CPBP family intramembrane glutamic endopeptidase [Alkaliphilus metalliredigens]ABR47267.1 Abortive infection protein [Alkaliphilus metalliredigens QYMF]